MATFHIKGLRRFETVLKRHQRARKRRIEKAIRRTAIDGAKHVRRNVPVAFSELRDSVHADKNRIVADAPHASAIEQGSRPHWPPLEPLIKWVKLRGAQALTTKRGPSKRLPGTTTQSVARTVGGLLKAEERNGALDLEAPERVAWLIARAISKRGTRPHWFMMNALPLIEHELHMNIQLAVIDQ